MILLELCTAYGPWIGNSKSKTEETYGAITQQVHAGVLTLGVD